MHNLQLINFEGVNMEFIIRELQKDDSNKRFVELQREYLAHMDKFDKDYSEGIALVKQTSGISI